MLLWVSSFLGLLILYLLLSWLPTLLADEGFSKAQAAGAQIGFNLGGGDPRPSSSGSFSRAAIAI